MVCTARRGAGSPPLTRGQRKRARAMCQVVRITPAHAGTTAWYPGSRCSPRDHPRSRGDNTLSAIPEFLVLGSPPLTRGQHHARTSYSASTRITPAHAGTTHAMFSKSSRLKDHPRSRGDNSRVFPHPCREQGSPPLTRGQPGSLGRSVGRMGITPAHAGTTAFFGAHFSKSRDHPRSRGDNHSPIPTVNPPAGSPPLTRGQRPLCKGRRRFFRITPAHAGTTQNLPFFLL